MKFCSEVNKIDLLNHVLKLVRSAKKEVFVTMNVDEELKQPLPAEYHNLLLEKKETGVTVIRFGYGSKKAFDKVKKRYPQIKFFYKKSTRYYQRMLLIDCKKGMFSVNERYFYTEFPPLVFAIKEFAKKTFNQRAVLKRYYLLK